MMPRPSARIAPDGRVRPASFQASAKDTGPSADWLRRNEFGRLDATGHVYLDFAGGALYAESQVRRHMELLLGGVFGNPHSTNPSAGLSADHLENARHRVLAFFNGRSDEYDVIFTGNASHALKLLGESYPFSSETRLLLSADNHNSVNGIREFARAKRAAVTYLPITRPDLRLEQDVLLRTLDAGRGPLPGLFAYPAQSNFSGVQHPLHVIADAHARGWHVLLDAAAFVPTNRLDLAHWRPDFVAISFYKMFGYPTGVGALIASRKALEVLRRPWFSGGTIAIASVAADRHVLASGPQGFEDGTVNYLSLSALPIGFDFLDSIGIDAIHERVLTLTGRLLQRLRSVQHSNGQPVIAVHGPTGLDGRGGIIAVSFRGPAGEFIDHLEIEAGASRRGISVRSGCFCNPGAAEAALDLSIEDIEASFAGMGEGERRRGFTRHAGDRPSGAVRVSLGLANTTGDVERLVDFASTYRR